MRSGSRWAPGPTRRSCATGPRRPGSRRCSTGFPEPLIAVREVAASGRSTARLDDAAVTAARLAEEVGPLVEIHGQHDQRRLLDERWQRDLLDAFGGHERARGTRWPSAVDRWRENRAALDAELALDPREVARRLDLLEHEAAEIAAARLRPGEADEIRGRLTAAQHGEAIARGAAALRDALTEEGARRPGHRRGRAPAKRAAWPGSTPASSRWRSGWPASRPSSTDVADEARRAGRERRPRPARRRRARRPARRRSTACSGATATTRPRSSPTASAAAAEAERLRGLDEERARRQREDADGSREVADGRDRAVGRPTRRRRRARRPRSARSSRSSGSRPACSRSRSVAAPPGRARPRSRSTATRIAFDAAGIDQVVYRLAPEPRRAGAGAGADRVGRRAVAGRARDQAGPGRGRRDADARLRRGRHRHRRPERGPDRAQPVGASPAATRSCASRTCPRSRPTPTPTTGSRSGNATAGRSPRSSASTARAAIVELAADARRADRGDRRRSRRRASCSTAPRRGGPAARR